MANAEYTPADLARTLSNAVKFSLEGTKVTSAPKIQGLREFAQAVLQPLLSLVDEGELKAEELVAVLATAALFVQMSRVMKSTKIPSWEVVEKLYE